MESDPQRNSAEQLEKSNKNLKIALGGAVAVALVATGVIFGMNSNAKKVGDLPPAAEPAAAAPIVPNESESPTPTEEVDPSTLTNEQISKSYTVDSNKIIAIPIQHTEEILSAHKSTPVSMDVKDYLSIVQNPEAKNGFMPGYKDGGKIIKGHPLEQYGANLTAYANLLLANLKIDDIDSVESYNLLKYGARDLVAGARQSQEKGGLVDPLNQDVIKATYELVKQLPAGSIATDAKITWMHWNLNDPWDLSNGTMLEYTIRSAEGEVSEHLIDVGTDRLEAFDSLDPIKSWSNVYSEPDALFVFNNK